MLVMLKTIITKYVQQGTRWLSWWVIALQAGGLGFDQMVSL